MVTVPYTLEDFVLVLVPVDVTLNPEPLLLTLRIALLVDTLNAPCLAVEGSTSTR